MSGTLWQRARYRSWIKSLSISRSRPALLRSWTGGPRSYANITIAMRLEISEGLTKAENRSGAGKHLTAEFGTEADPFEKRPRQFDSLPESQLKPPDIITHPGQLPSLIMTAKTSERAVVMPINSNHPGIEILTGNNTEIIEIDPRQSDTIKITRYALAPAETYASALFQKDNAPGADPDMYYRTNGAPPEFPASIKLSRSVERAWQCNAVRVGEHQSARRKNQFQIHHSCKRPSCLGNNDHRPSKANNYK